MVSSLSDYSPQHSPHSYFHVIIICSYPAVRVKNVAYVNMLGRNDLKLIYYLLERIAVTASIDIRTVIYAASLQLRLGKGTTQMAALVKGSVSRAKLFGQCPSKYCSYGRSSTRFFSKIASIFKKVLHLKDLNRHLECTGVSFNPENGSFSKIEK